MRVMMQLEMMAVKFTMSQQKNSAYGLDMADYEKAENEYIVSNGGIPPPSAY